MRRLNRRLQLERLESRDNPSPAQVSSIVINGGAEQRSRVTILRVNFNQPVAIADVNQAFTLTRVNINDSVTLNTVLDGSDTFATITFTGGAVDGAVGNRSLQDGRYILTAVAAQFAGSGLDGNGDGIAGDDYHSQSAPPMLGPPPTPPIGIYRLFGDIDGNGVVDATDFLQFRLNYLQAVDAFDFDGNGIVDAADFLRFRQEFI